MWESNQSVDRVSQPAMRRHREATQHIQNKETTTEVNQQPRVRRRRFRRAKSGPCMPRRSFVGPSLTHPMSTTRAQRQRQAPPPPCRRRTFGTSLSPVSFWAWLDRDRRLLGKRRARPNAVGVVGGGICKGIQSLNRSTRSQPTTTQAQWAAWRASPSSTRSTRPRCGACVT